MAEQVRVILCFLAGLFSAGVEAQTQAFSRPTLPLAEAERLALENDPVTKQFRAQAQAFSERAVAEGQLPDPQLTVGIAEVPLDNFNLGQHEDTEVRVGVSQDFPRGRTLQYKREQTESLAAAEAARAENQRRMVLRGLRTAFLENHYQQRSGEILKKNRELFAQFITITESQYAAGRDNQYDVLRAQLELSLLDDRLMELSENRAAAQAELAKWIGPTEAERPLPKELPQLSAVPERARLMAALPRHPFMRVEDALVEASLKAVQAAREEYKPGWMLDLMFSDNTGEDFDLQTGPDFLSAMVRIDLPIFREKRQDRVLAASQQEHQAAQYARADRLRELIQMAESSYAAWEQLGKRLELYRTRATWSPTTRLRPPSSPIKMISLISRRWCGPA